MKILYILDHKPSISETFINSEINGINDWFKDIDLKIFSLSEQRKKIKNIINQIKFPINRESYFLPLKTGGLIDVVDDFRPDLIHCHYAAAPASVGLWISKIKGIPFGFTCHAKDLFVDCRNMDNKLKHASYIICISEFNKSYIIKKWHQTSDKIFVNYLGVEVPDKFKKRHFSKGNKINLCTIARSVEKKGLTESIYLIQYLIKKGIDVKYHYIGDGYLNKDLQTMTDKLGLSDNIIFYGSTDNNKAMEILDKSDFFLLLCKKDRRGDMDGIPVSIMESMVRGIPVISTSISGIPEIIGNETNGFLVDANNPEQVEKIITCLSETKYNVISNNAYLTIKDHFNLKKNVGNVIYIFKKVTNKIR